MVTSMLKIGLLTKCDNLVGFPKSGHMMCVHVAKCMHACTYVHVCVYAYACSYIYNLCIYICMYIAMYVRMYVCIYPSIYRYLSNYARICIYVHIPYIDRYLRTYTYV